MSSLIQQTDSHLAGGVAGSVIANRLTENRQVTVLLLEAGPSLVSFPTLLFYFALNSVDSHKGIYELMVPFYFWLGTPQRVNWNYTTVPYVSSVFCPESFDLTFSPSVSLI